MRKFLSIIVLLFFTSINYSQVESLKGKVINSSNNEPLKSANIVILDKNIGVSSDEKGKFEIKGEFSNDDIIKFSYLGFKEKKFTVDEFKSNEKGVVKLESKVLSSQTVFVEANIGKKGETPATFSKIDRKEIEESFVNQDLPEYLSYLPSTTFRTEAGNGIGPSYLSIRGFDQRRISISINGIPQNDPEDHNVYWYDMPDLLASTEMIQVQRGSGSGVAGYPAVGGSINIITSNFSDKPEFELGASYGSYNTRKYTASFASGLIDNKYSIYAKVSNILSDGYRDLSWVDYKSYHISAVRYDDKLTSQINIYGGPIEDGLMYEGLPKFAIKDKELRRKNYSWWSASNDEFTWTTERRPEEKEEFSQPHYELLNEYKFNDDIKLNSALFLILGEGFFDFDGSWADTNYLRLTNEFGFNPTQNPGNVLIRAMVKNTHYGWIPRLSMKHTGGELILGGEFRIHRSVHWGSPWYGENLPEGVTPKFRYYRYEGGKDILNFFAHEKYNFNSKLSGVFEGHVSYHKYKLFDEKYVGTDFEITDLSFNPRIGLNYKLNDKSSFYLSLARVTREPRLKNYYDAAESSSGEVPQFEKKENGEFDFDKPLVEPETMNDVELGYNFLGKDISFSANFFYMLFQDEIVKQGQVDRFGQPITGNIDETVHTGLELSTNIKLNKYFELIMNGSYSRNYISNGTTFVDSDDGPAAEVDLTDNRISGFPNITFNGILKFRYEGLTAQLFTKYVGEAYSDNYDDNLDELLEQYPGITNYTDNKIESYFVANLIASYEYKSLNSLKSVKFYVQVNNLFDELYAAYAIGKNFFPAAERNIMTGIEIGF